MDAPKSSKPTLASEREGLPASVPLGPGSPHEQMAEVRTSQLLGRSIVGSADEQVGELEGYYVDDSSGAATWAIVAPKLSGRSHVLVPLGELRFMHTGDLRASTERYKIDEAPEVELDERLSDDDLDALREHYELEEEQERIDTFVVPTVQGVDPPDTVQTEDADGFRTVHTDADPEALVVDGEPVVDRKRIKATRRVPLVLDEPPYGVAP